MCVDHTPAAVLSSVWSCSYPFLYVFVDRSCVPSIATVIPQLSFRWGNASRRGLFASLRSSFSCPSLETFSDSCVSENVMVHSRFQWVLGDSRLIPTVYFIVRRVHLFPLDTFVEFHNVSYKYIHVHYIIWLFMYTVRIQWILIATLLTLTVSQSSPSSPSSGWGLEVVCSIPALPDYFVTTTKPFPTVFYCLWKPWKISWNTK